MNRIAVAGFFHETNTFAPYPADLATFKLDATFPGLCVGEAIIERFKGLNIGLAGAIDALQAAKCELVPLTWASAVPSGPVTEEAFETIGGMIVDGIAAHAENIDGVYLDFHGAMVATHVDNAETELVARIRNRIGSALPIVAGFDLHANLTAELADGLDGISVFRTYPHVDMADMGRRGATLLLERLHLGRPFHHAFRKLGFLVPLHVQCTDSGPGAAIYGHVRRLSRTPGIAAVEFAFGFPPADISECGPALYVAGADPAAVEAVADELEAIVNRAERDLAMPLYSPADAVREAQRIHNGDRPVVIADTQDNPGAGGAGDTVGMLKALLDADAEGSVLAILNDPAAARLAHGIGVGARGRFDLGAHSGSVSEEPVTGVFSVEALGDGRILATGPMYGGNRWNIGATALLRKGNVRVIVAERRLQAGDTAILRHVGLEPTELRIIVLKSSVHFRADFAPIAERILVAAAPGVHLADNSHYAYRKLRKDVRLMPGLAAA